MINLKAGRGRRKNHDKMAKGCRRGKQTEAPDIFEE
jgi:hypothetical protein